MAKSKKRKKPKYIINRQIQGYLFLLPNFLGFLILVLLPIAASLLISFTDWDAFSKIEWVGFKNYIELFRDETFWIALKNNFYFTVGNIFIEITLALFISVLLNKNIPGKSFMKTIYFLPYVTSIIAVAIVWMAIFHPTLGPVNSILRFFGMQNPPKWLASSDWALPAVILMSIWQRLGWYIILILAGLQGVPKSLYEAAHIDGANDRQRFFKITLPMLSPVMFFIVVMAIIWSLSVFGQILVMTNGGPGRATNVLVFYIYRQAFEYYKMGYASAIAYILFIITIIITVIQFRGQKKWAN